MEFGEDERGFPTIRTARMRLAHFGEADMSQVLALWTDPDVMAFMGGPREREKLEARMRATLGETHLGRLAEHAWCAYEGETGEFVGDFMIIDKEVDGAGENELVYMVAKEKWNRGFGTEGAVALREYAFCELGLKRVIALIDPKNEASASVAKKAGLRFERTTVRPGPREMAVYALDRP